MVYKNTIMEAKVAIDRAGRHCRGPVKLQLTIFTVLFKNSSSRALITLHHVSRLLQCQPRGHHFTMDIFASAVCTVDC